MRMIDGDALLETVEDHVTAVSCCPTVDWSMGKTQMKKQVIEDIRNAPTIGGWISVKDRLPEKDGQYLVILNKTHLMVVSFAKKLEEVDREVFAGRDEPGWFEWDTEWCGFYEVTMVTHWMPIPKIPQEVSEDE